MQSGLRDERVIIIDPEHLRALQSADDERDGLQLCPRFRYRLFVYSEGFDVEIVGKIFKPAFVGDLGGEKEETKSNGGCLHLVGKDGRELSDKLENGRYFGLPLILLSPEISQKFVRRKESVRTRCSRSLYRRQSLMEEVISAGYVKRIRSPPASKCLRAVCRS